jgi:CheY-like chemotaxis protein
MTRRMLADDQAVVRAGLRTILETDEAIEVVGEANDGREAVRLTQALDPDVVMMDIRMPALDGIQATERLMSTGARAKALILTRTGSMNMATPPCGPAQPDSCSRRNRRRGCARRCMWSPPVMRYSAQRRRLGSAARHRDGDRH